MESLLFFLHSSIWWFVRTRLSHLFEASSDEKTTTTTATICGFPPDRSVSQSISPGLVDKCEQLRAEWIITHRERTTNVHSSDPASTVSSCRPSSEQELNESRQRGGDHLLSRESAFPAEDDNTCRRRALEDRHVVRSTAICGGGQMANGRRIQAAKCPCVHHTHMPGTAPDHISQAGQPASPSSQQPTQPSPPAPTVRIKSTRKGVVNREKAFSPFRCMDKSSVILC